MAVIGDGSCRGDNVCKEMVLALVRRVFVVVLNMMMEMSLLATTVVLALILTASELEVDLEPMNGMEVLW